MKKILIKIYRKIQYVFLWIKKAFKKKTIISYEGAREKLEKYSPNPNKCEKIEYLNKTINPKIDLSIVIPVYNVEKYLRKCLDSILTQSTKYFIQVICIDDGSPDESYKVLDEYKTYFDRKENFEFVVISQENRGFSGARNRGIDEAVGKYLMFIDSDDYIEEGMIEALLDEAYLKDLEMVIGGWYAFDSNTGNIGFVYHAPKRVNKESPEGYHCYFWGKVYKREFFNDIRLPEGYWFEDMIVSFILHKKCRSFSYIDKKFYAYRQHVHSISKVAPKRIKALDQYWMVEYIQKAYELHFGGLDLEFYKKVILELSVFLYRRTLGVDIDIRKCVFACAAQKVAEFALNKKAFTRKERRFIKAFENKDFDAWEIESKCY